MLLLKEILGLFIASLLIIQAVHAKEIEDCPYEKGRKIQDLAAALEAHKVWFEKKGFVNPAVPGRADFCNSDLSNENLKGAQLSGANLSGANLWHANLEDARLIRAKLRGVVLVSANLKGSQLAGAFLKGANLISANLEGANLSDARLKGANLSGANLRRAWLKGTAFEDAILARADISQAIFQPSSIPAQGSISGLMGLRSVVFCPGEGSGLVMLRAALRAVGLRHLEREATYALESTRTRYALNSWSASDWDENMGCYPRERDRLAVVEGVLRLIFFEWTTGYGLYPSRPILILFGFIGIFMLVYLPPIIVTPKGREYESGIFRILPEGRIEHRGKGFEVASDALVERLNSRGIAALRQAFYFSVVSTFHLGWRDVNVGTWITRIQSHEFIFRAKGWVRVVSGFQSLTSFYLLTMSALTYFGRPFE